MQDCESQALRQFVIRPLEEWCVFFISITRVFEPVYTHSLTLQIKKAELVLGNCVFLLFKSAANEAVTEVQFEKMKKLKIHCSKWKINIRGMTMPIMILGEMEIFMTEKTIK